jgi:DNA adenine methylase
MAAVTMTSDPRPFLKWVGGKTRSLSDIEAALPEAWNRLVEPFLGGGATFFRIGGQDSILGDVNPELINAYTVVRDQVDALIERLIEHRLAYGDGDRDYYMEVRGLDRGLQASSLSPVEQAARTIFLNKTCVNGLYRLNKSGLFNVPPGKFKTAPKICDGVRLRACSNKLQGVELRVSSFAETMALAGEGDLVYVDPPYVPLSDTSDFASSTADGFGTADHVKLLQAIRDAVARGAFVLLSSSDSFGLRGRYAAEGWSVTEVSVGRSVSSKTSKRGKVTELLISTF